MGTDGTIGACLNRAIEKNKIIIQSKAEFSGEIVINKKLMSC